MGSQTNILAVFQGPLFRLESRLQSYYYQDIGQRDSRILIRCLAREELAFKLLIELICI